MFSLEGAQLAEVVVKLALAFVVALPVAWEREKQTRIMGLRTFPIVAMATCAYVLIGTEMFEGEDPQARVVQGLVAGMGFIGGGAILKREGAVKGTATASSIWATGAMGGAVAFGRLDIAIVLSVIIFLTLKVMTPLERALDEGEEPSPEG